jgi:hypothetical protein
VGSRTYSGLDARYGPAVNCSTLGWRWGGLNSILPLRDGKTILAFGVIHNGDLMMGTANRRTIMATYSKDPVTKRPVPTYDLGFGFALQSTDGGMTFDSAMINLDGPWQNQTTMFPKGEMRCQSLCSSGLPLHDCTCAHLRTGLWQANRCKRWKYRLSRLPLATS